MSEDLYRTLGVLPDAEDIVVAAAYRALAQRYHPDKWQGDPAEAHRRMSDINYAYSILGEKTKRSEYDRTRDRHQDSSYPPEDQTQSQAFSAALDELEGRWRIAAGVFPVIDAYRARLARISTSLAFNYVTVLLETKAFARSKDVADKLERAFLERYFGTDPAILRFAKLLSMFRLKGAARALNLLVDVLGSGVNPMVLIEKIQHDFGRQSLSSHSTNEDKQQAALLDAVVNFQNHGFFDEAKVLAVAYGVEVTEEPAGIFSSQIVATRGDGTKMRFKARTDFLGWAQQELWNFV